MSRDLDALLRHIAARETAPFAWGRGANDCASYALAASRAQIGRLSLPHVRWTTKLGAMRVMRRHGGIEALADEAWSRIAVARAQRGDIAGIADEDFGISLMVVEGETLVGPGDAGNVRLPRSAMLAAWSIEG